MKSVIVSVLRWGAVSVLSLLTAVAFMMVLGEKDPNASITWFQLILLKAVALIVLIACGIGWFWLSETGNLPKLPMKILEED